MLAEFGNLKLVTAMSECVRETTLGEILELSCRGRGEMDEEICLRIVDGKTAALFSAAARAGAIVMDSSDDEQVLADYGRSLGTAYQLMDDALDYASSREDLGKKPGIDLSTGTPTYPFVAALRSASPDEAGVMNEALQSRDGAGLKEVIVMIERLGGIGTTVKLAKEYSGRAKDCLERFPASTEKDSLLTLADFASNRLS
jgi:octaprenyl-diphosphate synthase